MLGATKESAHCASHLDRWLSVKIKYEIVQEIFLDLEYEKLMGRIGHEEKEFLVIGLRCWADQHFGMPISYETASRCTKQQNGLFWSRFEEKLDEKIAAVGGDTLKPGALFSIRQRCRDERRQILRKIPKLTQMCQEAGAIQVELLSRRIDLQKGLMPLLGKAMGTEAKSLASRTAHLQCQVHEFLLRPSQMANDLRESYEALMEEKRRLEKRHSELSSTLETLMAEKQKYLELANRRADAQRQMTFLHELQQPASGPPTQPSNPAIDSSNSHDDDEKPKQNFIFTKL